MNGDHRTRPRRRGAELEDAIVDAAIDELRTVGYAGMTIESVARRAGAGKVSIYRRWPTRAALALQAAHRLVGEPELPAEPSTLRADLLTVFGHIVAQMDDVPGEAMRAIVADALATGGALADDSPGGTVRAMRAVVDRAVRRGDPVDAGVSDVRMQAAAAMLQQHFLLRGVPDAAYVRAVVDDVALPLLEDAASRAPHVGSSPQEAVTR